MVMVHIHEARRERCRKRDNHRLRNDPIFRAKHYARKRLREYCKKHGIFKGFSASVELGCNSATFKAWIESKFTGRMGWHNHGEVWELDHIMPLATAATSDEVKRLCHYTNLQPLSVLDNRSKSDSVDRLNLFASQPIPIGCI